MKYKSDSRKRQLPLWLCFRTMEKSHVPLLLNPLHAALSSSKKIRQKPAPQYCEVPSLVLELGEEGR